jgi:hypothetical protein
VAGGGGPSGALASAEIWDPRAGCWTQAQSMYQARVGATATGRTRSSFVRSLTAPGLPARRMRASLVLLPLSGRPGTAGAGSARLRASRGTLAALQGLHGDRWKASEAGGVGSKPTEGTRRLHIWDVIIFTFGSDGYGGSAVATGWRRWAAPGQARLWWPSP